MEKKRPKTVSTSRKFCYFIFSTFNTVLFGQATSKPNQKQHLDHIGLLMDRSGSWCSEYGSGSGKKTGSIQIRIRNTAYNVYSQLVRSGLSDRAADQPAGQRPLSGILHTRQLHHLLKLPWQGKSV